MQDDEQRWAALMVASQRGDKAAYDALLTELARVIHAYLYKRFGALSFIDDCVQESLLAIHTARMSYCADRPFKPWFNAIVKYKTIDLMRRQKWHIADSSSNTADTEVHANADQESECNAAWQGPFSVKSNDIGNLENRIDGANLLNQLPAHHRKALLLTKLLGLSNAEAAQSLKISETTVKQHVHRALKKTRALLASEHL